MTLLYALLLLAFTSLRLTEFGIGFGSGKKFQKIPIHAIVKIT